MSARRDHFAPTVLFLSPDRIRSTRCRMGPLFLGVDGGGSGCRVRLVDAAGAEAGLDRAVLARIHAGVGLAGIMTPADLPRIRAAGPRFASLRLASDAHIACLGAFAGEDGAIVIVGTGSVGHAVIGGEARTVGGWGFEISDLGSGADIGREAVRAAVLGHDGLGPAGAFTAAVMARLGGSPARAVAWADTAHPRDYAEFARDTVRFAEEGDPVAAAILNTAAARIGALVCRLQTLGAARVCLMGGLGPVLEARLPVSSRSALARPRGDALDGAIRLARAAAAETSRCAAS